MGQEYKLTPEQEAQLAQYAADLQKPEAAKKQEKGSIVPEATAAGILGAFGGGAIASEAVKLRKQQHPESNISAYMPVAVGAGLGTLVGVASVIAIARMLK